MTYSYGQNFFNDLLKYSDKNTQDDEQALKQTYELQKRLNDFYVNNDKVVLLKSKKYGGMVDLLGHEEPLGGHINWLRCGARNSPKSCHDGCPDEYDFWNLEQNKQEQEQKQKQKQKQEQNTEPRHEKFTMIDNKEYLDNDNNNSNTWLIVLIVAIVLLLLIGGIYFSRQYS